MPTAQMPQAFPGFQLVGHEPRPMIQLQIGRLAISVLFGDTNGELGISTVFDFNLGGIGIFQIVCD